MKEKRRTKRRPRIKRGPAPRLQKDDIERWAHAARFFHDSPWYDRPEECGCPWSVLAASVANPPSDCVVWPFAKDASGYGAIKHVGRKFNAHRLALILYTGEDPEGMDAAHGLCHNRACINPLHLSWKSRSGNMLDMKRDGTHGRKASRERPNC